MPSLKSYFLNLNLFAPLPDSNEEETDQQHRWNIIGTQVYILLFLFILIGIGLSLSLMHQTIIITLEHPTKEQFEHLPSNTKCYCSQISIPYRKFTSLDVTFHQIYSSDLINFRRYDSAQFLAIADFCRFSKAA
ncbi:hypothetical protein I4U23_004690 [Adineta vaga]|nr:hypothetical protein I4U23_004690 [Adineta vaga]